MTENIRISVWIALPQLVRTVKTVFIVVIVLVMDNDDLTPVYNVVSVSVLVHPFPPLCRDPARLRLSHDRHV